MHILRHDVQSTSKAAPDVTSTSSAAVAYWTGARFYKNFIPLICQMNGLRTCTLFWPKTMVCTQKKLHHMGGHLIMWSYDIKKQLTLKKDKYNGHVASHVCLATWIAYITISCFLYRTITWSGDPSCDVVFLRTNHCLGPKRCAYPESMYLTD